MSSDARARSLTGRRRLPPWRLLGVTAFQVVVVAAIAWSWSTTDTDATSTVIDERFVGLSAGSLLVLAVSASLGRRTRRRAASTTRVLRATSFVTQMTTCALLGVALVVVPAGIVGAVFFGPMG